MALTLPITLTNGTTANAPDVMTDLNAIVTYINSTITPGLIPTATKAVFVQAAAPTGWVQDVSFNDQVIALTSGAGGGTGGSWTISGLSGPSHTHTGPSHTHTGSTDAHNITTTELPASGLTYSQLVAGGDHALQVQAGPSDFGFQTGTTGNMGSGGAMTLTFTTAASGTGATGAGGTGAVTADGTWRPAYAQAIVCTKT